MFKKQSLSFHVVSKTFTTQNYLFVIPSNILCFSFIALFLHILSQEIIEANIILKNNIIAGIILMTDALHGPDLIENTVFWS